MKLFLILPYLIFTSLVFGQEIGDIENSILKQLQIFPQKKIYLHTDKSTYVSGEKGWYRAYLVDAILPCTSTKPRFNGDCGAETRRADAQPPCLLSWRRTAGVSTIADTAQTVIIHN